MPSSRDARMALRVALADVAHADASAAQAIHHPAANVQPPLRWARVTILHGTGWYLGKDTHRRVFDERSGHYEEIN